MYIGTDSPLYQMMLVETSVVTRFSEARLYTDFNYLKHCTLGRKTDAWMQFIMII